MSQNPIANALLFLRPCTHIFLLMMDKMMQVMLLLKVNQPMNRLCTNYIRVKTKKNWLLNDNRQQNHMHVEEKREKIMENEHTGIWNGQLNTMNIEHWTWNIEIVTNCNGAFFCIVIFISFCLNCLSIQRPQKPTIMPVARIVNE